MCWNAEVSLGSFGIIALVSYFLWARGGPNDRMLAFFIFSYGLMQLFEALMWWGQNPEQKELNRVGSIAAAILLFTHPAAMLAGMSLDRGYRGVVGTGVFKGLAAAAAAFLGYGVWETVRDAQTGRKSFLSVPDPESGHLIWDFGGKYPIGLLLMILVGGLLIVPRYPKVFAALAAYFLIPAAVIRYGLKTSQQANDTSDRVYFGSYWCWWVAAFSGLFYLANPLLT
jgi:hypothetical protein